MRDRLIELIESSRYFGANTSDEIADNLIANGVIVTKVKVGSYVYRVAGKERGMNKSYNHIEYDCECGELAQIIIPKKATKDDIEAMRELLEVLIKSKYKRSEA